MLSGVSEGQWGKDYQYSCCSCQSGSYIGFSKFPCDLVAPDQPDCQLDLSTIKSIGILPGKISEIRGKSYTYLVTLKQLYEDDVRTINELDG